MKNINKWRAFSLIKKYRGPLGVTIIALSFAFLVWYCYTHPQIIKSVLSTSPLVLLSLLGLYCAMVAVIFFVNYFTVRICGKDLGVKQGILLTIYSTVINFFGPLQSGPGVRAVYLKTKIGLRIRDYTLATLFYYLAFGAINASILFISSWWILTILGFVASIILIAFGTHYLHFSNRRRWIFAIYIVALVQVLLTVIIYYIELHTTGTNVNWVQTLVYSASANLSLFVSLTPGGIGIREAFIVFTTSLHHIPLKSIVAAGVLDRAFYVVFLVLLFIVSSALHVKDAITLKKGRKEVS